MTAIKTCKDFENEITDRFARNINLSLTRQVVLLLFYRR
jgi:hypothetical protein